MKIPCLYPSSLFPTLKMICFFDRARWLWRLFLDVSLIFVLCSLHPSLCLDIHTVCKWNLSNLAWGRGVFLLYSLYLFICLVLSVSPAFLSPSLPSLPLSSSLFSLFYLRVCLYEWVYFKLLLAIFCCCWFSLRSFSLLSLFSLSKPLPSTPFPDHPHCNHPPPPHQPLPAFLLELLI